MQSFREVRLNPLPGIQVYGCWWGEESQVNDRPVIVLLHEGLGCVAMWRDFPGLLHHVTGLPVFAYDRPGYGLSGDLPGGFSEGFLEKEADLHLPAVLMAAGISGEIVLVGHSDGATLALLAAINPALKVKGVVTMAPHVIIEPVSVSGLLSTRKLTHDPGFIERLSKYHGQRTVSLVNDWLDAWLSPWGSVWQMNQYLEQIRCPILFIQGTDDHFGSEAQAHHIQSLVSVTVEVVMIGQCGHIPHLQAKSLVLDLISRFLASN